MRRRCSLGARSHELSGARQARAVQAGEGIIGPLGISVSTIVLTFHWSYNAGRGADVHDVDVGCLMPELPCI